MLTDFCLENFQKKNGIISHSTLPRPPLFFLRKFDLAKCDLVSLSGQTDETTSYWRTGGKMKQNQQQKKNEIDEKNDLR